MKIFLFSDIHPAGKEVLQEAGEIQIASNPDEETVLREAQGAHALLIRAEGRVTQSLIDSLPQLRVIGRHGVGVDNIEVAYAKSKGITVVNTPQAPLNATAEHTVAMLFTLSRNIAHLNVSVHRDEWHNEWARNCDELLGKTLGIIGMGQIGSRVAEIASLGIRMTVLYYDVIRRPEVEEKYMLTYCSTVEELLPQCDYVTLHVPLMDTTRNFMNRERFGLMKETAAFINVSRGGVVDTETLYEALQQKKISAAALDVYDPEPLPKNHPLYSLPNVIMTPHCGGMSRQSLINMALVAKDIVAVLRGEPPKHPV